MAALSPDRLTGLTPEARELLDTLGADRLAEPFYLAGSAALALYLQHREVRNLDLMSLADRLSGPSRRDLLGALRQLDPNLRVETARDGYLFARTGAGSALRFFYYPYPLIDPEEEALGVAVASPVDLGLMKVAAIISRGTRRDFVDLYLLTRVIPLRDLLARSSEKFGHVIDFPLQALKALADLSLVDGEPMPRLRSFLDWDEVEAWLRSEVATLGREHVGLEPA